MLKGARARSDRLVAKRHRAPAEASLAAGHVPLMVFKFCSSRLLSTSQAALTRTPTPPPPPPGWVSAVKVEHRVFYGPRGNDDRRGGADLLSWHPPPPFSSLLAGSVQLRQSKHGGGNINNSSFFARPTPSGPSTQPELVGIIIERPPASYVASPSGAREACSAN